jgi:replicative DNA helicase
MMADIRESGAIEQDASIIFMLWNSDENDRSQKGFKTEKSRAGQCGRVDLVFNGSRMRFDLADNVAPFGG